MNFELFGRDIFNNPIEQMGGVLQRKHILPPFSILDTRQDYWQRRKRAWLDIGIQSELGRNDKMVEGSGATIAQGTMSALSEGTAEDLKAVFRSAGVTVSIFDPVLCELMYSWFCPKGGTIIDPFAGGSVRGIIASFLGYDYWGCDLNAEQIDANREQAQALCIKNKPTWVNGDSTLEIPKVDFQADFIFSCPPYADLEIYSTDPRDLSAMEYPDFVQAYTEIIKNCYDTLKNNRFACFVVGEVRGKDGNYYGFVPDTIRAFQECGFHFYNELVLMNAVGSLRVRAGRSFSATRKIGKMHQNVLVFVKGDARKATKLILKKEEKE